MRNVLLENGKVVYALSPNEDPVSIVMTSLPLNLHNEYAALQSASQCMYAQRVLP